MRTIRTFVVVPSLPESLACLKEIAHNMCFCWDRDTIELFLRLDRDLWEQSGHNPVKMLGTISQERLNAAAEDQGFLAHLERAYKKMDSYLHSGSWYGRQSESEQIGTVAYFSAEFGLHESMPIYSGGLGILAGDHLKSASDLGLPLVGVGLLYRQGYFQQYLNADGWQQEAYPENDFYNMPVTLLLGEDGRPTRFHIDMAGHNVVVQVWQLEVGRVKLYLLDTNLRCNRIEDRQITAQLYGGDREMRLRQEVLLGIGGLTALKTLGIDPTVCHINEGHAAFLTLERIRRLVQEQNMSFAQAREATVSGNVFTTHTPVPAGHDVFTPERMEKYLGNYYRQLGISWQDFLALGRPGGHKGKDDNAPFSMTVLAMHLSSYRNGVSELHGEVSRAMCQKIWPDLPTEEIPVSSITNGIHVRSWISREMSELFDRYLGTDWGEQASNGAIYNRIDQIPDEEIWRTHERRRERLVSFARRRLQSQLQRRGARLAELEMAYEVLDPDALTIGFARRFATYKRSTLLLRDLERLGRILADKEYPIQLIFAGKAHPADAAGKELIRQIVHLGRDNEVFRRKIVFLENYDINVARYLVQGVDVWLNTPRRGMEASGTSGMKVPPNGGINVSILDGWWCEGYSLDSGWAIGSGETYDDEAYADEVESHGLYNILEKEVIPRFYDRGSDGLPRSWIRLMKNSMRELTWRFSTSRMVADYAKKFYLPSDKRMQSLMADDMKRAKALADWKEGIADRWSEVAVGKVDVARENELLVGTDLQVQCQVTLGSIDPADVLVELYYGVAGAEGSIQDAQTVAMEWRDKVSGDSHVFTGEIPCCHSGLCGFSVRVIPFHPDLCGKFDMGLACGEKLATTPATKAQTVEQA